MRRGRYKKYDRVLEFPTRQAKHDFITQAELQARYGRGHASPSSRCNQRVSTVVEYQDENGKCIRSTVEKTCDECGNVLQYDDRGYKCCASCGLIHNREFNIIDNELSYKSKRLRKDRMVPYYPDTFRNDAEAFTMDYYYSRSYNRGRGR